MLKKMIVGVTMRALRWQMVGKPVYVSDPSGPTIWGGTIMGVTLDPNRGEITVTAFHATDGISPIFTDDGMAQILRFPLTHHVTWNPQGRNYEVSTDGLDPRARQHPEGTLGGWAHRPGDRQAPRQEPLYGQGPSQAAEAPAQAHGGPDGESSRRVPPRRHVAPASESQEDGADDPGEDSDAGGAGFAGTLTLAILEGLSYGTLIAVGPDQGLVIYTLESDPPDLPPGSIIYGNPDTINHYQWWATQDTDTSYSN